MIGLSNCSGFCMCITQDLCFLWQPDASASVDLVPVLLPHLQHGRGGSHGTSIPLCCPRQNLALFPSHTVSLLSGPETFLMPQA